MKQRISSLLKHTRYLGLGFFLSVILILVIIVSMTDEDAPLPVISKGQRREPMKLRGSVPYWAQKEALKSFTENKRRFSSISLFWYFINEDGDIAKYEYAKDDPMIIRSAHESGVKVSAVITNLPEEGGTTWDSKLVEHVIEESKRASHISAIASLVVEKGFDGVAIDYESVDQSARSNFSEFIKDLSKVMHENNKFVGVALHPKSGKRSDRRYDFQDWQELGKWADELYIMAYGEHWDEGSAGPIASTPWVSRIIHYALGIGVPPEKYYLGIPLYGYDWPDGGKKAEGLSHNEVSDLIIKYKVTTSWDLKAQAPFFSYQKGITSHQVWFENNQSVNAKAAMANAAGFGGVTFWRLGGEDPEIWKTVGVLGATPTP